MPEGVRAAACPHHDARPDGTRIDLLVLADTQTADRAAALVRLRDAPRGPNWHYVIDRDGGLWSGVPETRAARGLGGGRWHGGDVGAGAVVIGLVHPGGDGRDYGILQMAAACDLCLALIGRHAIGPGRVVAHGDIDPARGRGPGDRFDWEGLGAGGVGLWPTAMPDLGTGGLLRDAASMRDVRRALRDIGYAVQAEGALDPALSAVLCSFQRRWRPASVTGQADAGTLARLLAVARDAAQASSSG